MTYLIAAGFFDLSVSGIVPLAGMSAPTAIFSGAYLMKAATLSCVTSVEGAGKIQTQSWANPRFEVREENRGLAEAEVAAPSHDVWLQLFDQLFQTEPPAEVLSSAREGVAWSLGGHDVEQPMQPVGEPGCDPARRHALVDLGRGEQPACGLARGQRPAHFMRNFGPRLEHRRQILFEQLVNGHRRQGSNSRLCWAPGQHADLAEMIARSDAQDLDVPLDTADVNDRTPAPMMNRDVSTFPGSTKASPAS